jgi:FkbM family methyltransferase
VQKVILDIGANSGYFSEYILINDKSSKVIAFEPNPKFQPNLESISKSFYGRFDFKLKAVADINGTGQFNFTVDPSGQLSSMLKPNPLGLWDNYSRKFSLKFSTKKVSICNGKFIEQNYGKEIYLCKIDVQGSDIFVARNLLQSLNIKFLVIEFQTSSLQNESMYIDQQNSLVNLANLITEFNLSTIKLFPNSPNLFEYNVLLSSKKSLNRSDYKFIDLLIESPIFKRSSEILLIGDSPYPRLVKKINWIVHKVLLTLTHKKLLKIKCYVLKFLNK